VSDRKYYDSFCHASRQEWPQAPPLGSSSTATLSRKIFRYLRQEYRRTARYTRIRRSLLEGATDAGEVVKNLPIFFSDNAGKQRVTRKNTEVYWK
jgi:hypothetical protein